MTRKEVITGIFGDKPIIAVIKKVLEYGAIVGGIWAFGLPAVREQMRGEIESYHHNLEEVEKDKIPFRRLLSQEMGVPEDRVHIVMGEMKLMIDASVDSVKKFSEHWIPYLEDEKINIRPRLEILPDGEEWWVADDNKRYRVTRLEDGYGQYFKGGIWRYIFK